MKKLLPLLYFGILSIFIIPTELDAAPFVVDNRCSGPGVTYRIKAESSNKYLQVQGNQNSAGANIQQWSLSSNRYQTFYFQHVSSNHYRIINTNTGKAIGVAGGSGARGANIELQNISNSTAQQFTFQTNANGSYHIYNVKSSLALNISGGSTSNGGNVIQWTVSASNNDNFFLERVSGNCSVVQCEAKVGSGAWQVLSDCKVSAEVGKNVILSTNPNQNTKWTRPDGSIFNGNDLYINNAQTSNKGWYYAEMNINGATIGKSIYLDVIGGTGVGMLSQYDAGKAISATVMYKNNLFVPLGVDGGGNNGGAFALYDISNPHNVTPVFKSLDYPNKYHTSGNVNYVGDFAEIHSLPVIKDGNYMVMSERRSNTTGFSIMNLTGFPNQQPEIVSRFTFPGVTSSSGYDGNSFSIACQGSDYVIAPTGTSGLFIVDIRDIQNPTLVKHMTQADLGNQVMRAAVVIGDLLILTHAAVGSNAPFMFLDISDPANPSILSISESLPIGYQPFVYGSELFTTADGDIIGYDFSDPTNLTKTVYNTVAADHLISPEYGFGQDGFLFIGHYPGLTKWDLNGSKTAPPTVKLEPTNPTSDDYAFLTPIGNLAIIASDHNHPNKLNIGRHKAGVDTNPPSVTYVLPADQKTNVSVNSAVGINFSDYVDAQTMNTQNIQVKNMANNSILQGSFNQMFGVINFVPSSPLATNTTYQITLKAGGIKDWSGNAIPTDTIISTFSTGSQIGVNTPFTINATTPQAINNNVNLSIAHTDNVQYKWNFGDGSPEVTTSAHNVTHQYSAAGNYTISVTATYPNGATSTKSTVQVIHKPLLSSKPVNSSSIIYDSANNRVWNVNPDNNTVTAINAANNSKAYEVSVGNSPQTLAKVDGNIWVANRKDATITIINAANGSVVQTVNLPKRSQPFGIVYDQAKGRVYVSLEAKGAVLTINASTKQIINTLNIATHIKNIALNPVSNLLYVTQFISPKTSGKMYVVNTNTFSISQNVNLAINTTADGQFNGRGLPNYLGALGISPDGTQAFIPSKKDNIQRGTFRDGNALTFEHTVRSMGMSLNLVTNQENLGNRVDFDNSDFATAAAFNRYGNKILVTTSGSSLIWVVDAYTGNKEGSFNSSGLAPRGLVFNDDGSRLFVHNFMERNVAVFDASVCVSNCGNTSLLTTIATVSNETLTAQVLQGKKLFYNSADIRLAQDNYMSCASCHLDGSSDGQVWDMTSFGEGLRNTIDLRGKGSGQGRFHWTGNFDEVHDFENQIRALNGGAGLMTNQQFAATQDPLGAPKAGQSADLDALAAYVNSLTETPQSPHKQESGALTPAAQSGQQVFNNLKCYSCHGGANYTNSNEQYLIDVGTLSAGSGKRLNQTLLGLDVPTLKGLWGTAPYLHDGSAATLKDVLTTKNPNGKHADVSSLSATEMDNLVEFLKQIDDNTPAATAANISAQIATPTAGQQLGLNKPMTLSISSTITNIQSVSYYVNGALVGTSNAAPFSTNYTTNQLGANTIEARITFGSGTVIISKVSNFQVFTIAPHCQDGVQNADETGVDCGGTDCNPCPTCNDGVKNGDEVGVDCGGSNCPACPCPNGDADGDGICNGVDLDDDNDGILNSYECPNANQTNTFSNGTGGGTHQYSRALTKKVVINFNFVDNSVQVAVNGNNIDKAFETERGALTSSSDVLIKFASGEYYAPWVTNSNGLPRLRVTIDEAGKITLEGTRTNTSTALEPIIRESNTVLPTINFGANTTVRIVNPNDNGPDGLSGQIIMSGDCDTDGDGIVNSLDLDSDNDGCLDALEGSATITFGQLVTAQGTVAVGSGSTAEKKNLGNTVNANGVPTVVGNGQNAGTAYNAGSKAPDCFPPDTQAPSTVVNLSANNVTSNSFGVTWNAATDNVGVTGYRVYLNGALVQTVTGTSATFSGLNASTAYTVRVAAIDAAGNASAQSSPLSVTTSAAPTCATIRVEVRTDNYGSETSWTLKNSANQTVMQGSGYASDRNYNVEKCLPAGCYTFRITDSYGDGMCCSWGNGYYKVLVNGTQVINGGSFGSAESKQVCTNSQSVASEKGVKEQKSKTKMHEVSLYPNPVITELNMQGSYGAHFAIYDVNGRQLKQGMVNDETLKLGDLLSGVYMVRFTFEDQTVITRRFVKQ